MKVRAVAIAGLFVLLAVGAAFGESFRVVGWNLESDRPAGDNNPDTSDPDFIAPQIAAKQGVAAWGFCEVKNEEEFAIYKAAAEQAAGRPLESRFRRYGQNDCLGILFNPDVFDAAGADFIVPNWDGDRAGLVQPLRWKATGETFNFVVNHLNRGNPNRRNTQAGRLNTWARNSAAPVIAVGDYNLDYEFMPEGERDAAYDTLTQDGVFVWARPASLVKTNASDGYDPSVLDFVFLAHKPAGWNVQSRIIEREGDRAATDLDFDDDRRSTDHRPVDAVISTEPSAPAPEDAFRAGIMQRIEAIEAELQSLRQLVESR